MKRDLKDGNTYRAWTEKSHKLEQFSADVSERLNPYGPCNFQFRLDNKLQPRILKLMQGSQKTFLEQVWIPGS